MIACWLTKRKFPPEPNSYHVIENTWMRRTSSLSSLSIHLVFSSPPVSACVLPLCLMHIWTCMFHVVNALTLCFPCVSPRPLEFPGLLCDFRRVERGRAGPSVAEWVPAGAPHVNQAGGRSQHMLGGYFALAPTMINEPHLEDHQSSMERKKHTLNALAHLMVLELTPSLRCLDFIRTFWPNLLILFKFIRFPQ